MNLISDALVVLGSRIGLGVDPNNNKTYLIRHDRHPGKEIDFKVGIEINGTKRFLPFNSYGEKFEFIDQESQMNAIKFTAIDPTLGVKLKFKIFIPFKPEDEKISTTPVIFMNATVEKMIENYRWKKSTTTHVKGRIFIEINGENMMFLNDTSNGLTISYSSQYRMPDKVGNNDYIKSIDAKDKIKVINGEVTGQCIYLNFDLDKGQKSEELKVAWAVYDEAIYYVKKTLCPFKYTQYYKNIEEVVDWATENYSIIEEYAEKINKLFQLNSLGNSFKSTLSFTFHSWLMNTWWTRLGERDWLTIWEGTCYYNSTVDVEYTQGPFYIAIWPELLKMQIDQWRYLSLENNTAIKDDEKICRYIIHDIGIFTKSSHQYYSHNMDIEENTNYILLLYAYWKRTKNNDFIKENLIFIEELLNYIIYSTPNKDGIPTKNCANTIDDAFDAIQYGEKQVYLSVKTMAAFTTAIEMIEVFSEANDEYYDYYKKAIVTIEEKGWKEDHYVVLMDDKYIDGKDAYHIYTTNGLLYLYMFGKNIGLDEIRIKLDLVNGYNKTVGKYGSRHSSFINNSNLEYFRDGEVAFAPKVGWTSMNMLRDIVAAYNEIDLVNNIDKYWEWQNTTNTQDYCLFFESFYGNSLHYYPRGVVAFGYLDALIGHKYNNLENLKPVRANLDIPVLSTVNWSDFTFKVVKTYLENGVIKYTVSDCQA